MGMPDAMDGKAFLRVAAACCLAGFGLAWLGTSWLTPGRPISLTLCGWGLAVAYGLAGLLLKSRAIGRDMKAFLRYGLAADVARLIALIAVLTVLRVTRPGAFEPVALAAVAGTLAFVAGEVWYIVRAG